MAQRYCKACGNALSDSEKFCAACGAPADDAPAAENAGGFVNNGAVPQAAAKQGGGAAAALAGKKNLIIIAAAAVVVVIIAVVVIMNLTKYQTIDAKDLVRVEFNGMDGKGTAVAVLNTDKQTYDEKKDKMVTEQGSDYLVQKGDEDYKDRLLKAYDKAKDRNDAKDMQDVITDTNKDGELRNLSFELSDEKNLKNGDTVTVTIEFDEDEFKEAGLKLENTEFEVTVEGLNTVETIDLFDYVEVKFDGFDGYGTYSVEKKADMPDNIKDYVDFSKYDYTSDLKNGDKVKVVAYVYGNYDDGNGGVYLKTKDDKYYDYGYKSGEDLTKEFEVSGLKELAEFDPMADVKVEFSGIGPYTINNINKEGITEEIRNELSFDYEWGEEYNIGDSVTIKVYPYSGLKDLGYKLKGSADSDGYYVYTLTITEDMVPVLVTKADEAKNLSEEAEATFENTADDIIKAYKNMNYKDIEVEVYKNYLVTAKTPSENSYDENSVYVRVYKLTYTDSDKKKTERYDVNYRYNVIKADGEIKFSNNYTSSVLRTDKKDILDSWNEDKYNSEEIK